MKTLMLPPKFKLGAALLGLLYKNPIMTRRGKIRDQ